MSQTAEIGRRLSLNLVTPSPEQDARELQLEARVNASLAMALAPNGEPLFRNSVRAHYQEAAAVEARLARCILIALIWS